MSRRRDAGLRRVARPEVSVSDPVLAVSPLGFAWQTADPFLFCVHHVDAYPRGDGQMAPAASLEGRDLGQDFAGKDGWRMYHGRRVPGFPAHPHRGFETVTIVRRGFIDHSDSLGAGARYGDGDVQWLTAGAGVVHAEMFPLLRSDADNPVELFQIWLNLPAVDKMAPPHFAMFWAEQIPVVREGGATITVVAGRFGDATPLAPPPRSWAARPEADVAIWPIRLDAGARLTLPPAAATTTRTVFVYGGGPVRVGGRALAPKVGARVRPDVALTLETDAPGEVLVLQGRAIAEPVAQHGPFVMNTRAELAQAYDDYQRTRFGGWPWPASDPAHALDSGRFARRPDGQVERPG